LAQGGELVEPFVIWVLKFGALEIGVWNLLNSRTQLYLRGRGVLFVMPAKAGIQFLWYRIFWIPAFAGMTAWFAENSPTVQLYLYIQYDLFDINVNITLLEHQPSK
jgi:hypothetical protein